MNTTCAVRPSLLLVTLTGLLLPAGGAAADDGAAVFRDQVRPLLTGKCLT